VAYCNNKVSQRRIADENAIPILVGILNEAPSEEIQVEVAIALGCIILSNPRNQEKLQDVENFKFDVLLELLKSKSEVKYKKNVFYNSDFCFTYILHFYMISISLFLTFSVSDIWWFMRELITRKSINNGQTTYTTW